MRWSIVMVALIGLGLGCDARRSAKEASVGSATAAPALAGERVLRWHFLGTAQLKGTTDAARLRASWALPSTQNLVQDTLMKLARCPQERLGAGMMDPKAEVASWLRPLLDDLLRAESVGECRGGGTAMTEWAVAVRLDEGRAQLWRTNWTRVFGAFGAISPAELSEGGVTSTEMKRAQSPNRFRLGRTGDWFVVGWGQDGTALAADLPRQLKALGRSSGAGSEGWLEVEANLQRLAQWLRWPGSIQWPQAHFSLGAKEANLRWSARLSLPEPLHLKLGPWQMPTNTIREPLVSFCAAQGLGSWLAEQPWVKALGLPVVPNQVFGWSQSQVPFQTFLAWRMPDITNTLPQLTPRLGPLLRTYLPQLPPSQFTWQSNFAQVAWLGLPVWVPFLRPALPGETDFVLAGVFPSLSTNKPPGPPELYGQVLGRSNLVYYHWESTAQRLADWRSLLGFYSMFSAYVPPPTNSPAVLWLADTNLTASWRDAVTQITVASPRELTAVRTSAIGLTGYEAVMLGRWLSNPAFPGYRPPEVVGSRPRAPKPGAATPPAPR